MMKDRSLQVKVVKDPSTTIDIPPIDYDKIAKAITRIAVICIVTYVGSDTLRRAAIYAMSAKF